MNTPDKVNPADALNRFSETWSPKIVGEPDNYDTRLVKIEGDFIRHSHDEEDGMFFVINGQMDTDFRDRRVVLNSGEFIIVPRGVEHKPHTPHTEKLRSIMLFERQDIVNTGNAPESDLTAGIGERLNT